MYMRVGGGVGGGSSNKTIYEVIIPEVQHNSQLISLVLQTFKALFTYLAGKHINSSICLLDLSVAGPRSISG